MNKKKSSDQIWKIKSFPLERGGISIKAILEIIIIILFISTVIYIIYNTQIKTLQKKEEVHVIANPVPVKFGTISENFPKEIPLNKKIALIDSSSFKNPSSGKISESSVVFESNANLDENKNIYKNWAKENNWKITENVSTNSEKKTQNTSLSFFKENKIINITIEKTGEQKTKIYISYKEIETKNTDKKIEESFKNFKL